MKTVGPATIVMSWLWALSQKEHCNPDLGGTIKRHSERAIQEIVCGLLFVSS
jgi:hypothetical protein